MPRDWELLRYLLMVLVGDEPGQRRDWSEDQERYHRYLLVDGGLAHGAIIEGNDSHWPDALLTHPTWNGHDFLSWASNEDRWRAVRMAINYLGVPETLEALNMVAKGTYGADI